MIGAVRPFTITTAQVVIAGRGIIRGYSIRETAGAAAVVHLWDNTTTNAGQLLLAVNLAANGADTKMPGITGILFEAGIYPKVDSGAVEMVIYVTPEERVSTGLAVSTDEADDISRLGYSALVAAER